MGHVNVLIDGAQVSVIYKVYVYLLKENVSKISRNYQIGLRRLVPPPPPIGTVHVGICASNLSIIYEYT